MSSTIVTTVEAVARALSALESAMPQDVPPALRDRLAAAKSALLRDEISIVVSGLFKAGKSTLINRLARWEILPSGGFPETGAPAILTRRKPRAVRARSRSGEVLNIAAETAAIAAQTSLYDKDGARRPASALASEIEIDAPKLQLGARARLIDLPGLRDTEEMDRVALKVAAEADLVLWVFRSEPAFSEQDTEFLSFLVQTSGPHVVQLVLNVFGASDKDAKTSWRDFLKTKLAAHRAGLRRSAESIGLTEGHVERLCVVDARRLRRDLLGVTFGGRQLFKLLAAASKRSDLVVRRARLPRVASAIGVAQAWLSLSLDDADQELTAAKKRWETYQARLAQRKRIEDGISAAVTAAFVGLDRELASAAQAAGAGISPSGFEPGASVQGPLEQQAATILTARASRLAATAATLAADSEVRQFPLDGTSIIIGSFMDAPGRGGAKLEELASAAEAAIAHVALPKPKWSWGRVGSFFKGEDKGVDDAISEARAGLRNAATSAAREFLGRKSKVDASLRSILQFVPIEDVAKPDPSRVESLHRAMTECEKTLALVRSI